MQGWTRVTFMDPNRTRPAVDVPGPDTTRQTSPLFDRWPDPTRSADGTHLCPTVNPCEYEITLDRKTINVIILLMFLFIKHVFRF